ncbi:nuclear transport factor 2 family protein [Antribacter sp. KLBMP9083]|uniref:Nuclear transport factor 2 family protein n=1 Tax=Antribacter soli TaxID=2910976 RepID=A0AA41QD89_9MICO|nr:nuclear transport factor 2 family protein [Antribacter soli]MCF4121012.1 nuclear transport factor 2 family protein [Antribacter soli]
MRTNHDIVTAHYAASAAGDLDAMLPPLSESTRWTEAAGFPRAGTCTGPEEVRRNVFEAIGRDFDGYRFTLERLLDAGPVQVGIGTYTGTCRATGKSFTARVAHVWHLRDGQVTTFEQIVDSVPVRDAMV